MSLLHRLRLVWNPLMYHGDYHRRNFFEGWYYKVVDPAGEHAFAFIPGIAKAEDGSAHAFVQMLDGKNNHAEYHKFPAEDFWSSQDRFETRVGDNYFSAERLELKLDSIQGRLNFSELTPWPWKPWSPGIMGWYSFVPLMECYHGVISLDHHIEGKLHHQGQALDFSGGRGYGEKDWGRSFPSSWIWMQTNHFGSPGISLSASVANIPWRKASFIGFIVGFLWEDRLFRFATYTGARLSEVRIDRDTVYYTIQDKQHRLEIIAHQAEGSELRSPVMGLMEGRVNESMQARVQVRLLTREPEGLLFEGEGLHAGLEVAGAVEELLVET